MAKAIGSKSPHLFHVLRSEWELIAGCEQVAGNGIRKLGAL